MSAAGRSGSKRRADGGGEGAEPSGLRALRAALASVGYRPSRRLGQNLLLDENVARAIARDGEVGPGDFVLEVGPGAGALTRPLAELGVRLVAVEIDGRLLVLARRAVGQHPVEFVHADVLASKSRLAPEVDARLPASDPWHLVSNLPYAIGGPLLVCASRRAGPPASMTVLVQREVADRLTASPGERAWSGLSARLAVAYDATRTRTVPAHVFWPRPKVESAVVRLVRRGDAPRRAVLAGYDRLVDLLFGHRRQTLGRVYGDALGDRDTARSRLEQVGIDPARRAETLSPAELLALAATAAGPG